MTGELMCHPEVVRTARRRRGGSSVAGGRSGRWGDGVAWCCDSGALCACIVIVCIHQQQGMVVVWRALVGRADGSLSVTGELMCHPEVVRADSTPAAL